MPLLKALQPEEYTWHESIKIKFSLMIGIQLERCASLRMKAVISVAWRRIVSFAVLLLLPSRPSRFNLLLCRLALLSHTLMGELEAGAFRVRANTAWSTSRGWPGE